MKHLLRVGTTKTYCGKSYAAGEVTSVTLNLVMFSANNNRCKECEVAFSKEEIDRENSRLME